MCLLNIFLCAKYRFSCMKIFLLFSFNMFEFSKEHFGIDAKMINSKKMTLWSEWDRNQNTGWAIHIVSEVFFNIFGGFQLGLEWEKNIEGGSLFNTNFPAAGLNFGPYWIHWRLLLVAPDALYIHWDCSELFFLFSESVLGFRSIQNFSCSCNCFDILESTRKFSFKTTIAPKFLNKAKKLFLQMNVKERYILPHPI